MKEKLKLSDNTVASISCRVVLKLKLPSAARWSNGKWGNKGWRKEEVLLIYFTNYYQGPDYDDLKIS